MDFDFLKMMSVGKEVEFNGKTYLWLDRIKDGLILAVEKGAKLPAPVVVIRDSDESKISESEQSNV